MAAGDQKPFTLQVVAEDREEGADRSVRRQSDQRTAGVPGGEWLPPFFSFPRPVCHTVRQPKSFAREPWRRTCTGGLKPMPSLISLYFIF